MVLQNQLDRGIEEIGYQDQEFRSKIRRYTSGKRQGAAIAAILAIIEDSPQGKDRCADIEHGLIDL